MMKLQKFNSINVIPFIDVLLVLLAIVLMTTTFITKGEIPVSLAKADTSKSFKQMKDYTIIIKEDNSLYFDKKPTSLKNIKEQFSTYNKQSHIFINSDKNANFDSFVKLLDLLKSMQFNNISIITKR